MRTRTFYRLACLAPFLVPLAGVVLGGLLTLLRIPGAQPVTTAFGFLAVAAWIGGLPYLVTTAIMLWRLRRAPGAAYARAIWLVPLPFAAILGLMFLAFALGESGTGIAKAAGIAGLWAACGLGLGYAYVALVAWAERALRRRGRLGDEP